jgi:hypothetical protein
LEEEEQVNLYVVHTNLELLVKIQFLVQSRQLEVAVVEVDQMQILELMV